MKIKIGEHAKVNIKWRVLPIDYSHEAERDIIAKFAKKYGIPRESVSVEPVFITEKGTSANDALVSEAAQNIQDPAFKHGLFKKYMEEHNITNCDFDEIVKIDNMISANIDYEVYDKHKRYTVKWIKWSNFMSYGPNNFFDFTKLDGLVQLTSEPANQGGKTTFCLDLFRFLLFGKVTSREDDWTLAKAFNRFLPEATEVSVEGCISIDDVDYVIKRVITRPELKKRTDKSKVAQKVTYYKVVNGEYIDLEDEGENETETTGRDTNKAIKEAIGNERDFDLMICVDSSNLKSLISLKDADRGRLIARWIGLLPLEDTDKYAREYFNKSVSPKLTLNKYSKEELLADNEELKKENEEAIKRGIEVKGEKEKTEKKIADYKEKRDIYLQSKLPIDEELTKTDKVTLEKRKDDLTVEGKRKVAEKEANEKKYEALKDVEFDEADYKAMVEEDKRLSIEESNLSRSIERMEKEVKGLKEGEYCPTCGAKLKGVDNTAAIAEKEEEIAKNTAELEKIGKKLDKIQKNLEKLEEKREKYNEKVKLSLTIDKNEVDVENLRSQLRECNRILKGLEANDAAIRHNNEVNANINLIDASIEQEEKVRDRQAGELDDLRSEIKTNKTIIDNNAKTIEVIEKEEVIVRNWKVYLEMVGRNGIAKMVLRGALPLINGELKRLLTDVCDFDVEVTIDEHNDVAFYIIKDGVRGKLGSGSGFEQTVASLALRSVLSKISTFSKPSFVVFDEVLGGVADENYDQLKQLYEKIAKDYACILQVSHLKAIADWHKFQIVIQKENNISKIKMA